MSVTPGAERRSPAMYAVTLSPGSSPPSPGLAPWATLISSCSAPARYAVVTPKRPEATWRIWLAARSPFSSPCRCGNRAERPAASTSSTAASRSASSPPSPELARPLMRAMATAMVSCASRESAPSDMPPVQKRGRTASTGSTASAAAPVSGAAAPAPGPAGSPAPGSAVRRSRSRSTVGGRCRSFSL